MPVKSKLKIYRSAQRHDTTQASAVTIGNFDGVHLGHQAILLRLQNAALKHNLASTVMTFTPHPRAYFAQRGKRPELIPAQINSLRDKLTTLAQHHIEQIVLLDFNERLANMSATTFIEELLVKGLNTRWLLVGDDFRYGHKRSGDIALLREAGKHHGFEVESLHDIPDASGQRISSSELRKALALGKLPRAAELLGRPYRLSGHVIHGRKLGRQIGFPTLNIRVPLQCAARSGVYIVRTHGLGPSPLPGVASLGVRPTVQDNAELLLEVHILDAQPQAYGKLICVEFLHFLRDEAKFPDLSTMITAIEHDVQCTQDYFANHGLQ